MPLAFCFPIGTIKDESLRFLLRRKKLGQPRGIAQAQDSLAGQKGRLQQLREIAKEERRNTEGRGTFTYFMN